MVFGYHVSVGSWSSLIYYDKVPILFLSVTVSLNYWYRNLCRSRDNVVAVTNINAPLRRFQWGVLRLSGAVLSICLSSRQHPAGLESRRRQCSAAGRWTLRRSPANGHRKQGGLGARDEQQKHTSCPFWFFPLQFRKRFEENVVPCREHMAIFYTFDRLRQNPYKILHY